MDFSQDHTVDILMAVVVALVLLSVAFVGVRVRHRKLSPRLEVPRRQCGALLKKNLRLTCRNRRAMAVQICVPFIFVALLAVIQQSLLANERRKELRTARFHSDPVEFPRLLPCSSNISPSCLTFGWVPANDTKINAIMEDIRVKFNLSHSEVRAFNTSDEADEYLSANPNSTQGIYKLTPTYSVNNGQQVLQSLKYTIQYNTTEVIRTTILHLFHWPVSLSSNPLFGIYLSS